MGDYQPGDRRPIASREWRLSQLSAHWLARRVSANAISLAGMVSGIVGGVCLAATAHLAEPWNRAGWLLGALFVQLRLAANMLDGMVAVASGKASPVGELYNEVPDRISDVATLIGLGYAAGGDVVLGYTTACAAVFTAYIRAMGKAAGARNEFCGPMAKPHRMFTVTVTAVYCGLTPAAAWQPVWEQRGLAAAALALILVGSFLTSIRRLVRIAAFLRKK